MQNMNNMAKFHNSMTQSKQTLRNTMRIMDKLFRPIYQECCEEWSAQDQNDQKHGHQQTVQGTVVTPVTVQPAGTKVHMYVQ